MLAKKILISLFLSIVLQLFTSLHAEIIEVLVIWNSLTCDQSCSNLIQKNFESLPQVESVSVNTKSGTATLKWDPKSPFSYQAINTKIRTVGVGLIGIFLRVRGYGIPKGNGIVLSSIGDNTQFILISPIPVTPGSYVGLPDGSTLSLAPDLQKKILNASTEKKVIVAEGPLYQGNRAPPLYLMIDRLQIEKKKQQ